jgi:hypothetical protein
MTTQQQAYINGFVKRAAQYGYNHFEAMNILKAAELKGDQHKLDVDKDGKIEGSDLKKLRQRKQAGFLSEGLENMKQMAGGVVDTGKQLASNLGDSYNSYIASKNTPSPEDIAKGQKARDMYVQQMAPQPEHQKLPGYLSGGTMAAAPVSGGTMAAAPVRKPAPMGGAVGVGGTTGTRAPR